MTSPCTPRSRSAAPWSSTAQPITGLVDTTMGRMIFNRPIPQDLGFVDRSDPGERLEV